MAWQKRLRDGFLKVLVGFLSFLVFGFFDILDPVLCIVYKIVDYVVEAEWKACYCYSSSYQPRKTSVNGDEDFCSRRIVLDSADTKIVCHCLPEDGEMSETLFLRKSVVREIVKLFLRRREAKIFPAFTVQPAIVEGLHKSNGYNQKQKKSKRREKNGGDRFAEEIVCREPRWSDCNCDTCASWRSNSKESLFCKIQGISGNAKEITEGATDVLFIHGFISSSTFWTETLFPNFSEDAKSSYRLIAVDLLGFGRSPKPRDSMYTLDEHVDMLVTSVLRPHRIRSFHVVAHSLGCIIALALAARFPDAVKSLTLVAPPYFPVPEEHKGRGSGYVLRQLAPRKVWPLIALGASMASWYEHVSRTICLLICKHHRFWDSLFRFLTFNRVRTYLIDGFMCHTHHAAWHTLHNVICGTATRMEDMIDQVRSMRCSVSIYHGLDDELLPASCSRALKSRIAHARLKIIPNTDHLTIVVRRQHTFAKELEHIWKHSNR